MNSITDKFNYILDKLFKIKCPNCNSNLHVDPYKNSFACLTEINKSEEFIVDVFYHEIINIFRYFIINNEVYQSILIFNSKIYAVKFGSVKKWNHDGENGLLFYLNDHNFDKFLDMFLYEKSETLFSKLNNYKLLK